MLGSAAGLAWGGQEPSLRDFGQGTGDVVAPGGGRGDAGRGQAPGVPFQPAPVPPGPRGGSAPHPARGSKQEEIGAGEKREGGGHSGAASPARAGGLGGF